MIHRIQRSAQRWPLNGGGPPARPRRGVRHWNPRPPQSVTELGELDALLLRSFRFWLVGLQHGDHNAWALAWNDLARQLGSRRARVALGALTSLVNILCGHARRRLIHHQPCCPCLCPDEASLISLIADCRAGDGEAAKLRAEWLVQEAGAPKLVEAAKRLTIAFGSQGITAATVDEDVPRT